MLEKWWNCLAKIEEDMKHSLDLREKWKSFVSPSMQWCREVMLRLYESGFKLPLPAGLVDKLKYLQHSIRVSLPSERGGNKLRMRERAKMNKRVADVDQWHTLFTSPTLVEYERSPVQVTPTAERERPKAFKTAPFQL